MWFALALILSLSLTPSSAAAAPPSLHPDFARCGEFVAAARLWTACSCRSRIHRENGGGPRLRLRQRRRLRFPLRLHYACAFLLSAHHPHPYLGQFGNRTTVGHSRPPVR